MTISREAAYCSTLGREAHSQLFGTASRTDVWLLLEYAGAWGRDAFKDSDLPDAVKAHLNAALAAIPNARLQLIKQDPPHEIPGITFAVAICREDDPALYTFKMRSVEEVLQIEIADLVSNEAAYVAHRAQAKMILICTNAKRDRCCALRGLPVYGQLVEIIGTAAWRTTHLAGHRFAATGVVLPDGIVYGRIDDAGVSTVAEEALAGRIHLPALRGRSCYPPVAQAADYYLRDEIQVYEINALHLTRIDQLTNDESQVRFADTRTGIVHELGIRHLKSDVFVPTSCGAELERADAHELLYHNQVEKKNSS